VWTLNGGAWWRARAGAPEGQPTVDVTGVVGPGSGGAASKASSEGRVRLCCLRTLSQAIATPPLACWIAAREWGRSPRRVSGSACHCPTEAAGETREREETGRAADDANANDEEAREAAAITADDKDGVIAGAEEETAAGGPKGGERAGARGEAGAADAAEGE
jgi:hypothetical protein